MGLGEAVKANIDFVLGLGYLGELAFDGSNGPGRVNEIFEVVIDLCIKVASGFVGNGFKTSGGVF